MDQGVTVNTVTPWFVIKKLAAWSGLFRKKCGSVYRWNI